MDISLNWLAIVVVSFAIFAGGALWFGPIFGKLWIKIHGMEGKTEAERNAMMQGMWKLMASEAISVILMVMTLDFLILLLPEFSGAHTGFLVWLGFVFPTYVTGTVWGGDKRERMFAKIVLMSSYRLLALLVAGYVLGAWK